MAKEIVKVPDIGGAEDAEVVELLVAVGDRVDLEQSLLVLESDKASMEIPSTAAGEIVELMVVVGDKLAEGAEIVVVASDADDAPADTSGDTAGDSGAGEEAPTDTTPEANAAASASASAESEAAPAEPASAEPAPSEPALAEFTVTVPDIGTGDAVDLVEISVAIGDSVAEGDSLVVLESDKASMEVPSPRGGEVIELLVEAGQSVREGDNLLRLRSADADAPAAAAPPPSQAEPAPASLPAKAAKNEATPVATPAQRGVSSEAAARGVYAGPAVRKLARELGVDLTKVSGSGPRGRLLKEDLHQFVQKALRGGAQPPEAGTGIPPIPEQNFAAFGDVRIEPRSKLDKLTAANMQRSWLNVPHVTQFDESDITELEAFRSSLKAEAEQRGTRLTPMPFLLKACAVALRMHPKFNASLTEGGSALAYKNYVHIGMAVDTPAGLMVPVLRDVDRKSLWQLAQEIIDLAALARDRKLKPDQMQGGCFTVSSLGAIGGDGFTPIINAPEVGILGVSRAAVKPVWDGSEFQPRTMLPLALSYDHRVINGGDAGRFLTSLVALLGDIRRFLL